MLAQSIAMQISLTLTTVISMRNLADPGHEFSRIRMWGTIGWVAVGLLMGFIVDIRSPQPFYLAGVLALIVGIYGWTLPHTPPKGGGKTIAESFGLPAFQLFRDRSFVVFVLIAYIASMINQFYGVYGHQLLTDLKISQPERWMTIGQAFEIAVMFTIPLLQPKRWLKWLMLLGLMGWILRGVALMTGSKMFALCLAVPMHGWSYAFFYIVAAIYIDREAPPHLRASTQAILAFVAGGLGPWTGNLLAAWVVDQHRTGNVTDWPAVWLLPTIICTISAIVYVFCFHPPPE